ncbi:polysaccharide export protein [Stutzerimonas urumqiensis]|uniref:polysaccharide biosynthesis/export family protein n=1 Tax=Stutzerimonas urumqiensis TaxID=638269 RepID=UPI003BADAAF9
MRIHVLRQFFLVLLLGLAAFQASANDQYQLSSGDVIKINVYGEPDLSFDEIRLNDAGTFSFPFIGEIDASGKTAGQVRQLITSKLQDGYLVDPRVSVSVVTYRSFYISGEVKEPGGYPYQPGLTLDRAIALAGGLTERASTNRITIVRNEGGNRVSQDASLETKVQPGDTITIDQGFF